MIYLTVPSEAKVYVQVPFAFICSVKDISSWVNGLRAFEPNKQEGGVEWVLSWDQGDVVNLVIDGEETVRFKYDTPKNLKARIQKFLKIYC